jgi:hypothetical protein
VRKKCVKLDFTRAGAKCCTGLYCTSISRILYCVLGQEEGEQLESWKLESWNGGKRRRELAMLNGIYLAIWLYLKLFYNGINQYSIWPFPKTSTSTSTPGHLVQLWASSWLTMTHIRRLRLNSDVEYK